MRAGQRVCNTAQTAVSHEICVHTARGFLAVRVKRKCFQHAAHSEAKVPNAGLAAHAGRVIDKAVAFRDKLPPPAVVGQFEAK